MKMERVYREILYKVLDEGGLDAVFRQKELSHLTGLSISTVNYALKPLENMNAVRKRRFGFNVTDPKKILLYWASIRKLTKEIAYQTFASGSVESIESSVPSKSVFTAYTAYKLRFGQAPSDYGEIIIYGEKSEFEKRFPPNERQKPNIVVLRLDEHLLKFRTAPLAQIFVDLWNLETWYAGEFLKKLEAKIDGIVE
jgi:DNA-binding transcriptional ArsR family regulator